MKLILAFVAAAFVPVQAISASCAGIKLESVKSLTTQQVGQLLNQRAESNAQFTVVLWNFDSESHPRRGALQAVAFLVVGMGDIDEQPVGAFVWSSEAVGLTLERGADTGIKIIATSSDKQCTPASVEIRMKADGTVFGDKQKLGKVR